MAEYIPGVCNIGPAEIKNRRNIGILWGAITLFLSIVLYILPIPSWSRIIILLPATVAFSGFYQATFHFCAGYGYNGLYNVAKSVGHYDTVEQKEYRKKDKSKAQQIFGLSIISASILTLIFYFI